MTAPLEFASSLVEQHLILQAGIERDAADPLARWKPMSAEQDRVCRELGRGEILFGSGNEAGKTTLGKVFVALAQGRKEIQGADLRVDGRWVPGPPILLPSVPQPSQWVVASLDFKQQILSVQPKYLSAIGTWPHKARWNGDTLESLRIKPIGFTSPDPRDWSLITFISAKNLQSGVGFRGHGYHCDEPPPMWLLAELRKMAESGTICIGVITATMLKRSQWQPLRPDYPIEQEGRWHGRFLRVRAPAFNPDDLDDDTVGNRSLTREDKERLLAMYANAPEGERLARILGLEIDAENSNPLRDVLDEITKQHGEARDGEIIEWKVSREVPTPQGKQMVTELVETECWADVEPGHVYRVVVDTSLGISDGAHDPGMAQVVDMTIGAQVERYEGFLGEYGLGVLSGALSRKWNHGSVDVATTAGYGENCLSGLRAVGCRSIVSRQIKAKDGKIDRTDIGFKENTDTRKQFVGALIEAFKAARMGHPWLTVRSRADLAQMMDLSWDDKDRTVRIPGVHHGESVVTLGRVASLLTPEKYRQSIPAAAQRMPEGPIDLARKNMGLPPLPRPAPSPRRSGTATRPLPRARVRWR